MSTNTLSLCPTQTDTDAHRQKMIEDLFEKTIPTTAVCYPSDGENAPELLESLHAETKKLHKIDLDCLYSAINREP
jgi:hypothetical protein